MLDDAPVMPLPELTLPALRQAVAVLVPSRLPEFFNDMQAAFVRAGDEDSVIRTLPRGCVLRSELSTALIRKSGRKPFGKSGR